MLPVERSPSRSCTAGAFANSELTGTETVGPSAGIGTCRPLRKEELEGIISAFTRAARRAKEAGFDAVQVHGAHGFLLSEFLSPAFNKRTDEYGGSIENRARLLLEVVRSVRLIVGSDFPILVKLNSEDFLEGGLTAEESVKVSRMLEKASVDAVEFSGGTGASPQKFLPPRPGALDTQEQEVYYREAAKLYEKEVSIPLMLVGGIRSYEVAAGLVENGIADYIALSRPPHCRARACKTLEGRRPPQGGVHFLQCLLWPGTGRQGYLLCRRGEKEGAKPGSKSLSVNKRCKGSRSDLCQIWLRRLSETAGVAAATSRISQLRSGQR